MLGLTSAQPLAVTHLSHLNYWRNALAHQSDDPPPAGIPAPLSLALARTWLGACDGLARALDGILYRELTRLLGTPPW